MSNEGSLVQQEEPMGEGETYKAFKERARLELQSRHAGRAGDVQQRLLRARLRHFLLTVGAEVNRLQGTGDGNDGTDADGDSGAHGFAIEQKRLAIARESAKVERHRSARVIQKFFRHCQRLMRKDEEELLSTSVLVAMMAEQPAPTLDATQVVVPYVNRVSPPKAQDDTPTRQERKKPIARRVKKTHTSFQRKRALQFSEPQACKSDKPEPHLLLLKDSMSSPIGRISRAEALSPPSSPSSIASSEAGEMTSPQRQVSTSHRFFPPKHQNCSKPTKTSPPKEEQETHTKASSPRAPTKSFLRRKPSKVVFHKLDWSGVTAKTDSNLPTNGSSRANPGAASRIPKTSRSAATTRSSNKDGNDVRTTSSPGAFIDAHTAARLAALESSVYERCGVARETASLARFKYQKERKKFAATLQSQMQQSQLRSTGSEVDNLSSKESGSNTVASAVTELWKKLTGDSSGELYAVTLRNLLERPTPKESPLTQKGNFNVELKPDRIKSD